MARNLSPKCKQCRRAGEKLFLKGDRCATPKCGVVRRAFPPGVHGPKGSRGRRAGSEYGQQLAVKQKMKRVYGILERQFKKYYTDVQGKAGVTGDLLVQKLESRLDNVIYRSGFASNRAQARQLARHAHFTVNGKRMNIPSYEVKVGDEIQYKAAKQKKEYFKKIESTISGKNNIPGWLELDGAKRLIRMKSKPTREDMILNIDIQMVIEYYSR